MELDYNVVFFYRNHKVGYSIKKVSDTLASGLVSITKREVPSERATFNGVISNLLYVYKNRSNKGINHITGDIHYCILSLIGTKSVLTVHDTSAYDMSCNHLKRFLIKYLWFVVPLLLAGKIVCISAHTAQSLKRFTKRKDIIVIGNAIDKCHKYVPKKFNKAMPVILMIGTTWNKNICTMLKSLETIKCKIVIIGRLTTEMTNLINNLKLSVENDIGFVSK